MFWPRAPGVLGVLGGTGMSTGAGTGADTGAGTGPRHGGRGSKLGGSQARQQGNPERISRVADIYLPCFRFLLYSLIALTARENM